MLRGEELVHTQTGDRREVGFYADAVVAFAVLADGAEESDDLRARLVDRITEALGKALRPKAVLFVDALPKTRNAKVMRRVIRAAHLGDDLGNVTALEDEAAVDAIREAR